MRKETWGTQSAWVSPLLNYRAPKPSWRTRVGDGSLVKQDAVPGEVLQGSGYGLVLFGTFFNCLGDGKENMKIQFAGDIQLGRAYSTLTERVRLPDDLRQAGKVV